MMVREIWTATGNEGILDRDRNFALQQATNGPLKELLQGLLNVQWQIFHAYSGRELQRGNCLTLKT